MKASCIKVLTDNTEHIQYFPRIVAQFSSALEFYWLNLTHASSGVLPLHQD